MKTQSIFWRIIAIGFVAALGLIAVDSDASENEGPTELYFTEMEHADEIDIDYYTMHGPFTQNSSKVIKEFLDAHPGPVNILMASEGGYASDITYIMDVVRVHGNVTFYSSYCLSACAVMAAAGKQAYGTYHFHGVYRESRFRGQKVLSVTLNREVVRKLVLYGWDEFVAIQAMSQEENWLLVNIANDEENAWTMANPQFVDIFTELEVMSMFNEQNPEAHGGK